MNYVTLWFRKKDNLKIIIISCLFQDLVITCHVLAPKGANYILFNFVSINKTDRLLRNYFTLLSPVNIYS